MAAPALPRLPWRALSKASSRLAAGQVQKFNFSEKVELLM
jgi:hypothetical protein